MDKIDMFHGQYGFLSNFFPSQLIYMGVAWPTVEHLFQALKLGDNADLGMLDCKTPGDAKRRGRTIPLREDWERVKDQIMLYCLRMKFNQPGFGDDLLRTGKAELIEGNWWHDNYWGACRCLKCQHKPKYNRLGHLLMFVRNEIYTTTSNHMWWL